VPLVRSGSHLLEVGDLAHPAMSADTTLGAPLTALPIVLDLPGHHSALVPFLMGAIDARTLVWFDGLRGTPSRAVRVVNGSDRTLPDGPLGVYRGAAFTSEGVLHRARPGEAQYVHLGGSADASVQLVSELGESVAQRLAFAPGREPASANVVVHSLRTSTRVLELAVGAGASGASTPLRVAVALPIVPNATLQGADAIDYDVVGHHVVGVFELPAGTRKRYQLQATEGVEAHFPIAQLTEDSARSWLATATIPAAERAIVEQALPAITHLGALATQRDQAEAARSQTQSALRRVRAQLDKTQGEAATPLVTRLLELEQELGTHETHLSELAHALGAERSALAAQLQKLPAQPR